MRSASIPSWFLAHVFFHIFSSSHQGERSPKMRQKCRHLTQFKPFTKTKFIKFLSASLTEGSTEKILEIRQPKQHRNHSLAPPSLELTMHGGCSTQKGQGSLPSSTGLAIPNLKRIRGCSGSPNPVHTADGSILIMVHQRKICHSQELQKKDQMIRFQKKITRGPIV